MPGVLPEQTEPALLLLDTDTRNAQLLATLLHADGYQVETCKNGAAALARVAQAPRPRALILDVSPARTGDLETVRSVHTLRPDLIIFLITAHPQVARSLDPEPQGWLQVYVKPLDYPALLRALAESELA